MRDAPLRTKAKFKFLLKNTLKWTTSIENPSNMDQINGKYNLPSSTSYNHYQSCQHSTRTHSHYQRPSTWRYHFPAKTSTSKLPTQPEVSATEHMKIKWKILSKLHRASRRENHRWVSKAYNQAPGQSQKHIQHSTSTPRNGCATKVPVDDEKHVKKFRNHNGD